MLITKTIKSQEVNDLKDFTTSFLGLKTPLLNVYATITTYFITKYNQIFVEEFDVFLAITVVVIGDFIMGIIANKNDIRTRRALKVVWYLVGYWSLAAICLTMQMAFKSAFWLTDTVIVTILTFQIISILKNMAKAGIITNSVLKAILDKVDKHKDVVVEAQTPIEQDQTENAG